MIQLEGIGFSYAVKGGDIPVLSGVDAVFERGKITAIVGRSGSGKTSLLRLLAGLSLPQAGKLTIDGRPGGSIRQGTSLIFQDYGLLPWETVEGNAELGLEARGVARTRRRTQVGPILKDLGLERFSNLYPSRLSGGMRQRVAVARALASRSDLLLMDEPFSSLDALSREALQDSLLAMQAKYRTTIVLVTHSIEEAVYLADSVYILEGRNPSRLSERFDTGKSGRDRSLNPTPQPTPLAPLPVSLPQGGPSQDGKSQSGPNLSYRESEAYFADLATLRRRFFSGSLEPVPEKAGGPGEKDIVNPSGRVSGFLSKLARTSIAALLLLALWELLALALSKPFLPLPALVLTRFVQGLAQGSLLGHILASLRRVFGAILLAAPLAWVLGLTAGRIAAVDTLLSPLVYLLHPLPKVAFLPLLMLFLGLGDAPKLALMGLVVFGQLFVGARDSSKTIPAPLVDTVRSLGGRKSFLVAKVVIPSTIPMLLSSLRISLGTAIAVLFLSETFASMDGLGWYIMDSWSRVDYPDMYAAIMALSLTGLGLYLVLDALEAFLLRWRES
jgi:ABC-type nitrate/sulfonate/bicarbonate transport system ATPase subunit/ABC-type nitrate/sulfonate/bicarbonate transport system permease component